MSLRSLLAVSLLMGAALAGCLGGDDATPAAADGNDTADGLNTTAPDGRGDLIAFEETNLTEEGAGGVDHHHDHWGGASRIVVYEGVTMMDPFPDTAGVSATFGVPQPPEGRMIYEGTASVEFTISKPQRHACEPAFTVNSHFICTDWLGYVDGGAPPVDDPTGGPAGLTLRYKHASTTEWLDVGTLTWNTPIIIQITHPTQTDMPHATSSVWQFQVVSPNSYDATLLFTYKIEIVRAEGEIPLWPPHPLFYTPEKPSRVVVDNVAASACDSGFTATGCIEGEPEQVIPDKLISFGTRTLYVWVNVSDLQMPSPATAPTSWFLYHVNVTGRENATVTVDPANYGMEKRELFWILPVDDGAMDSPYADGSKWWFQLSASYVPPENPLVGSCYDNCADWNAKYTITVVASSEELPADQYHMACIDSEDYCPGEGGEEGGEERRAYTAEEGRARGYW